jgi:6-pyruvoyltetrahydropterin/6-carboxytetrahydropterin synthase
MKIGKQFHWEMGHRLPFHKAGCANIHGHSYTMWVELEGALDEHGMLLDYGIMKQFIQPIIDKVDHCFICDENDNIMKPFLASTEFKVVYVPFTTTAEHICEYMLERIWEALDKYTNIERISIRLQETGNAYAEISQNRQKP